jgi:hypothetical protein
MSSLQTTSLFLDRKDYAATQRIARQKKTSAGAVIRIAMAEFLAREAKKRKVVAA